MAVSRRRPPPQQWDAIPGYRKIRVVCTDRGQHPEVSFGSVDVWPEGEGWHVALSGLNLGRDEYVDLAPVEQDHYPERLHKTYPLKCRRCGRDRPLRAETLEKGCAELAAQDIPKFDISALG